ncbi:MAG TPA: hypothetical protein PK640_04955, partial [Verrucomicrobiota bacterium]|nr:hypothetical protein [Verrucomicrobiota bacterium]
ADQFQTASAGETTGAVLVSVVHEWIQAGVTLRRGVEGCVASGAASVLFMTGDGRVDGRISNGGTDS